METVILVILCGLAWGSFLNVVIYRLPAGLSLVKPPSSCPSCHERIKPYDNIPVLSYFLLRGKCRHCGTRIPFSYVLVEVLTPAAFVVLYLHYSLTFFFFASGLFTSALIVLCFIDYRHKILPDKITFPGIVLALVYSFFRRDLPILQALLGSAVGAGFLLLIYGGYYLVRKKEGLGLGDVTMMIMVGAYLGWVKTLLTLILASFVGAFVGILIIAVKKKDLQYMLPFGTFLAPAAYVALVWGDRILVAYLSLFQR
ncbi:MAG: prepilin peptidase [Candidatus Aminicenantes bacterium]|nr:prepilin peptidase [Candidatus Aminicenantes bacterium]